MRDICDILLPLYLGFVAVCDTGGDDAKTASVKLLLTIFWEVDDDGKEPNYEGYQQ